MSESLDQQGLDSRLRVLSRILASHGGDIRVARLTPDGDLRVELTGRCQHCPLKPMTMAATVRPLLAEVEGVEHVTAEGVRISEEAARRLMALEKRSWTRRIRSGERAELAS
jgi:Fe-S cluster biogenesis protein NfuA